MTLFTNEELGNVRALEIDGEPYWDGGFTGNPTITPLIRECDSTDTILVSINPIERPGTPRTAMEIQNRLNEISFFPDIFKSVVNCHFITSFIIFSKNRIEVCC